MSVDYYLTCEKHKKCIHVAQDGFSGFSFYSGESRCMKALNAFLAEHSLCGLDDIRWRSEHYVEDYEEVEWPTEWASRAGVDGG